ncbi:hypothetical protein [Azospira restricta]|uniref:Uncharacterized protein n=1 Tax=Azospira restricta TaxID=404405 RepID=A0A974SMH6_9RHOO|nr:hypothetical protein [Azospira restricta]QRJ63071.1 hypothetical protein IWH25_15155 [Azospira restricta]
MRIWMAAGLAVYLALSALGAQSDGLSWHGALGWLQPGLLAPVAEEPAAGLPPAPLQRELMRHAAG